MQKFWTFFLTPIFLIGADLEQRVSILEEHMREISSRTANQTLGVNFAPDHFKKRRIGLFLIGKTLYWQPKIGGTEYAYNLLGNAMGFNAPQLGELEDHSFNWGWGFQAGLGLIFSKIGYELICTGTWYSTDQINQRSKNLPSVLINLQGASLAPSDHARFHYDLSYEEVRFEIKKNYFLSRFFSTYTSIGIKRSWVDQKQKLRYRLLQGQTYRVKDVSYFQGTGARIGFGTKCHLFLGLSLIADVGGSLLYGDFDVKHKENLPQINEISLSADTHLFSPELDFAVGLGWDLCMTRYHFDLSINYEALYSWRQNEALEMEDTVAAIAPLRRRFQIIRYAEDITFYGITLRAILKF